MIKITIISTILLYSILPTLYYRLKWYGGFKTDEKEIMLTFDDGPSEEYTMKLLDLLKSLNIKVSFFMVTDFLDGKEHILKRMVEDGHLIGLHSTKHKCSLLRGIVYTKRDIGNSLDHINSLGVYPKYYRPPWGILNLCTIYSLKKQGVKLILWNVMAEDWRANITSEEIKNRILKRTKAGSIICLHDGRGKNQAPKRTIQALEVCLPKLLEEDYKFVRVDKYY